MKKVFFYLFTDPDKAVPLRQHEYLACQKAFEAWQQNLRTLMVCQSKEQAEKIDEYLWQFDTSRFLPHNLVGEGPQFGAPVEICWLGCRGSGVRQLLINLQDELIDVAVMFNDVVDFVPFEEKDKMLARKRYKAYKNLGFNLKTIQVAPVQ